MNKNTTATTETREGWLLRAIELFRPWFDRAGSPLPTVHVSVGFGGPGHSSLKVLGVCWHAAASADGKARHIFLAPTYNNTLRVLDVLLHELCHAALPDGTKHGAPFGKLARHMGMEGKMTATTATPELVERLKAELLPTLGEYPHPVLKPGSSGVKKQGTRMIKCTCPASGYVVRTTQKWIDECGAPVSPVTMLPMEVEAPKEEEDEE